MIKASGPLMQQTAGFGPHCVVNRWTKEKDIRKSTECPYYPLYIISPIKIRIHTYIIAEIAFDTMRLPTFNN